MELGKTSNIWTLSNDVIGPCSTGKYHLLQTMDSYLQMVMGKCLQLRIQGCLSNLEG